jgi:hypothetical protein
MEDYVWPMICDECHRTNGLAEWQVNRRAYTWICQRNGSNTQWQIILSLKVTLRDTSDAMNIWNGRPLLQVFVVFISTSS